ncbi:MAG: hypothetical protein ACFCU5_06805 [Pleurocapsa sp.]
MATNSDGGYAGHIKIHHIEIASYIDSTVNQQNSVFTNGQSKTHCLIAE